MNFSKTLGYFGKRPIAGRFDSAGYLCNFVVPALIFHHLHGMLQIFQMGCQNVLLVAEAPLQWRFQGKITVTSGANRSAMRSTQNYKSGMQKKESVRYLHRISGGNGRFWLAYNPSRAMASMSDGAAMMRSAPEARSSASSRNPHKTPMGCMPALQAQVISTDVSPR